MCCLSCVCILLKLCVCVLCDVQVRSRNVLLKLCVYVLCGVQVRSRNVLLKLCVYIAKVVCVCLLWCAGEE